MQKVCPRFGCIMVARLSFLGILIDDWFFLKRGALFFRWLKFVADFWIVLASWKWHEEVRMKGILWEKRERGLGRSPKKNGFSVFKPARAPKTLKNSCPRWAAFAGSIWLKFIDPSECYGGSTFCASKVLVRLTISKKVFWNPKKINRLLGCPGTIERRGVPATRVQKVHTEICKK